MRQLRWCETCGTAPLCNFRNGPAYVPDGASMGDMLGEYHPATHLQSTDWCLYAQPSNGEGP